MDELRSEEAIETCRAKMDPNKGLFSRAAVFHPEGMKNKPCRGELSPEGVGAAAQWLVFNSVLNIFSFDIRVKGFNI